MHSGMLSLISASEFNVFHKCMKALLNSFQNGGYTDIKVCGLASNWNGFFRCDCVSSPGVSHHYFECIYWRRAFSPDCHFHHLHVSISN